ncbi:MAG: hypothetical protein HXS54_00330 [Theionarchaea archaeon]|nr:hypothetical protein [Theionarchaea archaeon]
MKGKIVLVALGLVLLLNIPETSSGRDYLTVEYEFNAVLKNGQMVIENTLIQEIPGEPVVIYCPAQILLPQDTDVKAVKITHSTPIIERGITISWGQPPCTFDSPPQKNDKNEADCISNEWYPRELYKVVSVESFRGYRILNLMLCPVQYNPKSQTVKFYPELSVTVEVGKKKHELYRGLRIDREAVRTMVDNPEVLASYQVEEGPPGGSPLLPSEIHEYIIITNNVLLSAFKDLAHYKNSYLNSPVRIVEVEWIYSEYQGEDEQEKIRNFIRDAYEHWGTVYCLLGGDVSVVPYRAFLVEAEGEFDEDLAADMYYGCLDGDFDANGNGKYGEPDDDVDWLAEVYIGRAPVETGYEAELFINKVVNFELAEKPTLCQFHQARLYSKNEPDSMQIARDCEQWVPGEYEKRELFEEDGFITKDHWRDAWGLNPLLFQHTGDGATHEYFINFEVEEPVIWEYDDVHSLCNDFWPVHMSVASFCGEFEAEDCLAEAYINNECGAVACMMNSSRGWYSLEDASMYSGDFLETMFRALFEDGKEHLGELLNQAKSYWTLEADRDPVYRWCYYEINLLGDPETPILTQRVPESPGVTITNPQDEEEVYGMVDISVSKRGCVHSVEFYINGEYKDTDNTGPTFNYSWNTTSYPEEEATIQVKGYCDDEFVATDTVTVMVNNCDIEITNPQEGEVVSGALIITTETRCISIVNFYIDGAFVGTDTEEPFEYELDTCFIPNGPHTITVYGYYAGVLVGFHQVTIQVSNNSFIEISNPQEGEVVSDIVTITTASCGVAKVKFCIDGNLVDEIYCPEPFEYEWNTCFYSNGSHTIAVYGYDASDVLVGFYVITCQVQNEEIEIISPQNGEYVSGIVTVTAYAPNCVYVVHFYIDGNYLGYDWPPGPYYEHQWNTCCYSNGPHTIKVARSYGGYTVHEEVIAVTVLNFPFVTITNPQEGEEVSGTVPITTDTDCVNKVEFYIDALDNLVFTDTEAPFEYDWDTTSYSEDEEHTIIVKGYCNTQFLAEDSVTVLVNNCYVRITNPQEGETVSGTVPIMVDATCVDVVRIFINDSDPINIYYPPYTYDWDTTLYPSGPYTIYVDAYLEGEFAGSDTVNVTVSNNSSFFFLIVFAGLGRIITRRH